MGGTHMMKVVISQAILYYVRAIKLRPEGCTCT